MADDNRNGGANQKEAAPSLAEDEFTKRVIRCREDNSPDIIENASIAHAAVLFKQLLIAAKDRREPVVIVSGEFMPTFYAPLMDDLKAAMKGGCKVRGIALVEDEATLKDNGFYQLLKASGCARAKRLSDDVLHFICVGKSAYRVELDEDKKTAKACFNDQGGTITSVLTGMFDSYWAQIGAGGNHGSGGLVGSA